MVDTLQQLQQDFADSGLDIDSELSSIEYTLDRAAEKLRAGRESAGKDDAERCRIAADLIIGWLADCGVDSTTEADSGLLAEFLEEAAKAVLLDKVGDYAGHRKEASRLWPLLGAALATADEESRAESHRCRQERQLYEEVKSAYRLASLDRETLGIGADVELTHEVIEQAQAAAEKTAGPNKRGKPYARFGNAAKRLRRTLAYTLPGGGQG
jgi:hypothetical protein